MIRQFFIQPPSPHPPPLPPFLQPPHVIQAVTPSMFGSSSCYTCPPAPPCPFPPPPPPCLLPTSSSKFVQPLSPRLLQADRQTQPPSFFHSHPPPPFLFAGSADFLIASYPLRPQLWHRTTAVGQAALPLPTLYIRSTLLSLSLVLFLSRSLSLSLSLSLDHVALQAWRW